MLAWDSDYGTVLFPSGPLGSQEFSTGMCPSYVLNGKQTVTVIISMIRNIDQLVCNLTIM